MPDNIYLMLKSTRSAKKLLKAAASKKGYNSMAKAVRELIISEYEIDLLREYR